MSSEIVPPSFPESRSDEYPAGRPSAESRPEPDRPEASSHGVPEPSSPATGPGTASADDLALSPDKLCPDPLLDEFLPGSAEVSALSTPDPEKPRRSARSPASASLPKTSPHGSWSQFALDLDGGAGATSPVGPARPEGESWPAETPKPEFEKTTTAASHPPGHQPSSRSASDLFPAIDLSAPPVPARSEATGARANVSEDDSGVEDEEGSSRRGSNWPMTLLASYASAVTIGLIWVLWGHRAPRESVEPDFFPPADNAADPGQRADRSRKFVPLSPLPADRVAGIGQTFRVGSLEVNPLEISSGPVILRRAIKDAEMRRGGEGALALRVRLKNLSSDSIFSPMDEAFLRERGRGVLDSFIESGPIRRVAMFPLAVVSEWSIVGQEFRELKPGESYETLVVSAPDVADDLGPDELIWRIRLRTDIDRTETVGVRFRPNDVVPKPGPHLPKKKEPAAEYEWEDSP